MKIQKNIENALFFHKFVVCLKKRRARPGRRSFGEESFTKTAKTRISACFFALLLGAFSLLFCGYTETDDFFRYTEDEAGNLHIVGYEGYDRTPTIPGEIGEKKVVAVDATAFYGNAVVRRITVSAGIERIEESAFAYCENLNRVTFEAGSGAFIGEAAFEGCALLERVDFSKTLEEIDDLAFRGCLRLGEVTLPASLTRIGYHAFADCESLVFRAENCPPAREYAEENGIALSAEESGGFLLLEIALLSLLLLLLLFGLWAFLRKRKKKVGTPSQKGDAGRREPPSSPTGKGKGGR